MSNFLTGLVEWRKDAVSMMMRCYFEDIIIMRWMDDNMLDFDVLSCVDDGFGVI